MLASVSRRSQKTFSSSTGHHSRCVSPWCQRQKTKLLLTLCLKSVLCFFLLLPTVSLGRMHLQEVEAGQGTQMLTPQ
jgi:hypothetical protein